MQVVIRTDSSSLIGSGHLMRCLTLADMLTESGADVEFICRDLPNNLNQLFKTSKFKMNLLPRCASDAKSATISNEYAEWLGVDWEEDAEQTAHCLNNRSTDWLIVDHYALDKKWEKQFRPIVSQIMVIDDLANRKHDCDLILDQNLYHNAESRYDRLVPDDCVKLLGLDNSLMRREFYDAKKIQRSQSGNIRQLLVFLGGADVSDETSKAIKAISKLSRPELFVDVVVGGANVHSSEIRRLVAELPHIRMHGQIDNMARLMASADLAIGGGGSTTWERCFLGLPTITIVIADNQKEMIEAAAEKNALWNLGWHSEVTSDVIHDLLKRIVENPSEVIQVSTDASALMANRRTYLGHPVLEQLMKANCNVC